MKNGMLATGFYHIAQRGEGVTYEVLVDVGSTLVDGALEEVTGVLLAGDLAVGPDVSVVAGNVLGGGELDAVGEGTGAGGVEDSAERAGTVGGDDVEGSGDAAAGGGDLGKGAAGHGVGGVDVGNLDLAVAGGAAETVGHDVLALENSGVDFSLHCKVVSARLIGVNTVVNRLTFLLGPVRGTTPPWLARAVPLPPRLPVRTTGLPWAATRGAAARAKRRVLETILID